MKMWKLTLASCLIAGTAAAQPTTTDLPPPPADPVPEPEPAPPPPPEPAPAPAPVVAPAPAMTQPIDDHRPSAFSVGIGLGYELPTSLETPNTTTVRFRLPSGVTFEPRVSLTSQTDIVDMGDSVEQKTTELGLGTLLRYPLSARGRVDFELLGAVDVRSVSIDPPNDDDKTTITTFGLGYGLGVGAWVNSHWQVSMSALNALVTVQRRSEEMGPGAETVTSTTKFGLVWDPTVLFMVHLYH